MGNDYYPYLCGGTFLVLLIEAKKKNYEKDRYRRFRGDSRNMKDGIAGYKLIANLIEIFYQETKVNYTVKSAFHRYKCCQLNNSAYLPFTISKNAKIPEIDERIKNDYLSLLRKTLVFTEKYIDIEDKEVCFRLAKALLELIEKDRSIPDDQKFYAQQEGCPISKSDLVQMDRICLPALLLGVWHFIIHSACERKNTNGQSTFEKWHKKPEKTHARIEYIGDIGENYPYPKNVSIEIDEASEVFENSPCDVRNNGISDSQIPQDNEEYDSFQMDIPEFMKSHIINNTDNGDEDVVEDIPLSKKTDLSMKILNMFTEAVREHKVAKFLGSDDLQYSRNIQEFIEKIESTLMINQKDIQKKIDTEEELFYKRIFKFISALNSVNHLISFVASNCRSITLLNKIKEDELSTFEKFVINGHTSAIKLFREIAVDNNLSYEDIVSVEDTFEDNNFSAYESPIWYRSRA